MCFAGRQDLTQAVDMLASRSGEAPTSLGLCRRPAERHIGGMNLAHDLEAFRAAQLEGDLDKAGASSIASVPRLGQSSMISRSTATSAASS
jgi:hypothetical protein